MILREEYEARHFISYDPEYNSFLVKLKRALDANQLKQRVLNEVFSDEDDGVPFPSCEGTWLEFGVHTAGKTLCQSFCADQIAHVIHIQKRREI